MNSDRLRRSSSGSAVGRGGWRSSVLLVGLVSALAIGCSGDTGGGREPESLEMAALDHMPRAVQRAPVAVQEAYQFAVANPDVLRQVPCYCGCGAMGHTSNLACYVSDVPVDTANRYDSHALGCSICVDITQDVMRLMRQGRDLAEIQSYIYATYTQYGPSNIP